MTTTQKPSNSLPMPSDKALEAAAMSLLAEMIAKDKGRKPSLEAARMAARYLAGKAKKAQKPNG